MNMPMFEVKIYSIGDLKDRIVAGKENGLNSDCISNARAWAIINNPYARDEYPAIAVASVDDKIVGYTAVFPDMIGTRLVFWGTTGFVSQEMRGKGLGTTMYSKMMHATNGQWLASDSAPAALKISIKTKLNVSFFERYYLNFKREKSLRSVLKYEYLKIRNRRVLNSIDNGDVTLQIVKGIDDLTYEFICRHSQNYMFTRTKEMLNWILQFPFKAEAPSELETYSSYDFTTAIEWYNIYAFRIIIDKHLVGFAMFRNNMGELTLLYNYFDVNYKSEVFRVLSSHVLKQHPIKFKTFDSELISFFDETGIVSMNSRTRTQKISLSVPAEMHFDEKLKLQCGDGDMFC